VRGAEGGNMHLHGGKAADNAPITVWESVNQPNLLWTIQQSPHGGFWICSVTDPNFVVHQFGAKNDNDGAISVWNKNTHGQQGNLRVNFEQTPDGYFKIIFVHSNKCVHVFGGGRANGTKISQWEFVNQANLKWSFHPEPAYQGPAQGVDPWTAARHGMKLFVRGADGGNMHLHGGKAADNAPITIYETLNQPNLMWTIQHSPHGGFWICSVTDQNFVVHQFGATNDNDGAISVWNKNTHGQQGNLRVNFEQTPDGYYKIIFVHSGKCVHVFGGGRANDTKMSQWEFVNQNNLKWSFIPA